MLTLRLFQKKELCLIFESFDIHVKALKGKLYIFAAKISNFVVRVLILNKS